MSRNELNILIATNIRQNRLRQKLTEEDLAGKSGLSVNTIKKVERGCQGCTAWTLVSLASALNMSTQSLVQQEVNMSAEIQVLIDALEPQKCELARNILYALKVTNLKE